MDIAAAIVVVRYYLRSGGSSTAYSDAQITSAVQTVCDEFVRRTKCAKRVDTISLTAAALGILPSMPSGFRPDRLLSAYLTGTNVVTGLGWGFPSPYYTEGARTGYGPPYSATVDMIPYQQLLEMKYSGTISGQPQCIAFSSGVVDTPVGEVFPMPDQTYTCNLLWYKAFSTADATFIIADDIMRTILANGVAPFVQKNEPESISFTQPALKKYDEWVNTIANAGSLGSQVVLSLGRRR